MKGINVQITDGTHLKLCQLKKSLRKSNLADLITSLVEEYSTRLDDPSIVDETQESKLHDQC